MLADLNYFASFSRYLFALSETKGISFPVLRHFELTFCRRKLEIFFKTNSEFLRPSEQVFTEMKRCVPVLNFSFVRDRPLLVIRKGYEWYYSVRQSNIKSHPLHLLTRGL